MNKRYSLCLLVLLSLVFNQVAACIHIVEHVTPATSGEFAPHSDTNLHDSRYGHVEHQHSHFFAYTDPEAHYESTSGCFFYHVILATPGSLTAGMETAVLLPGEREHIPSPIYSCVSSASNKISIRGPPDNTRA